MKRNLNRLIIVLLCVNFSLGINVLTAYSQTGTLICEIAGNRLTMPTMLAPRESRLVSFEEITLKNPQLWWPNGIGEQVLHTMKIYFETAGIVSDIRELRYGIREITSLKCPETGGRKFYVNGQPIYITGGNYIASDWVFKSRNGSSLSDPPLSIPKPALLANH